MIIKCDVAQAKKSDIKINKKQSTEEILKLKNNRKSTQRVESSSKIKKTSCEDLKDKKSNHNILKIRNEKHNPEEKKVLMEETNLSTLTNLPYKNVLADLARTEVETKIKNKIRKVLHNFEIRNSVNGNEEPKAKYNLEYCAQSGLRNWQSHWKEFEADFKKDVRLVEDLLERNDPDSLANYALLALIKLNTFSASLKQKYPYRARIYYCLGKSYVENGNYRESFKCSIELLRIGEILKDNKIVYSGYNVACKAYTKLRNCGKAAELWQRMISMEENLCERAKLHYILGNWYFILSEWELAKTFGEFCLKAALAAVSNKWCMMAFALIGKSAMKLHDGREALNALYNARHYKSLYNNAKRPRCAKPTASVIKKFTKIV